MRHAKRTVLTADDVDSALSLRNVEVNYLPMIKYQDNSKLVMLVHNQLCILLHILLGSEWI